MSLSGRHLLWGALAILIAWKVVGYLRVAAAPRQAQAISGCPLPQRTIDDQEPLQSRLPGTLTQWNRDGKIIRPLAGFSVNARVLSREDYSYGIQSDLSPMDLALGWGRMTQGNVLQQLDIRQSGRWYSWRYEGQPPLPVKEISSHSSNMHIVPADERVARTLAKIDKDDRVRLEGWLVEIDDPQARWKWRSSLRRDDTGDGACELVYVCAVTIEGKYP
jgi:hypothetical protein